MLLTHGTTIKLPVTAWTGKQYEEMSSYHQSGGWVVKVKCTGEMAPDVKENKKNMRV